MKRILHQCVICKKREGVPYRPLPTADLPEPRVSGSPAYVKSASGTTNQMKKSVHLFIDLCNFESVTRRTDTRPLNRSLRQVPAQVHSQTWQTSLLTTKNAKTFKRANKGLGQLLHNKRMLNFAANQGITWNVILEKAP